MVRAFNDDHALIPALSLNCIDQPVLARNPTRPKAGKISLEGLRLADSPQGGSTDVLDKLVEPLVHRRIVMAPVEIILTPVVAEVDPQAEVRPRPDSANFRSRVDPAFA